MTEKIDKHFRAALEGTTLEEIAPLAKSLDLNLPSSATELVPTETMMELWDRLSYNGSNDIAFLLRGFRGIDYPEIVRDVCAKQKVSPIADGDTLGAVRKNEQALIISLFDTIWNHMSDEEKRILLEELHLSGNEFRVGGGISVALQQLLRMGGFNTFRIAVTVANTMARGILGRGISFAGNAALTRGLGVALGPIGWVASGAWVAFDIASPAFRKTVPAVVQVAALRQLTASRKAIGVMCYKASSNEFMKKVFNIDPWNQKSIRGFSDNIQLFDVPESAFPLRVLNFPNLGPIEPNDPEGREIRKHAKDCDLIVMLFNGRNLPDAEEIGQCEEFLNLKGRKGHGGRVIAVVDNLDSSHAKKADSIFNQMSERLGLDEQPHPSITEAADSITKWIEENDRSSTD